MTEYGTIPIIEELSKSLNVERNEKRFSSTNIINKFSSYLLFIIFIIRNQQIQKKKLNLEIRFFFQSIFAFNGYDRYFKLWLQ